MAQQALAVYQNFLYSFWNRWKIFLGSFLNPYTIYKTARLSLLLNTGCTQCRFLRRSFLILSRRAHTHAVSVKSILYWKKKSCPYKQLFSCSARTFTATFLSPQLFSCQCAPSLKGFFPYQVIELPAYQSQTWAFPVTRRGYKHNTYHAQVVISRR